MKVFLHGQDPSQTSALPARSLVWSNRTRNFPILGGFQLSGGRVERRLAAVVAADVAGFSRLMGLDEIGTARTLREHRAVSDALVAKHGGRIVKTTGDGILLEFPSVVDAVECAVAMQTVMAERNDGVPEDRRMLYRIGINLGDILIEGDDILGDGVNVAARLESIAEPGGICISSSAYDQVSGKVAVEFTDLGEQCLKNIANPVRVYAARSKDHSAIATPVALTSFPDAKNPLPLPDKPSIAILPFQNMSGDPEQEYFADGMVDDIIIALSRFKALFVIARNSSFTYKGRAVDIKQVGRELGVRYVLEGSVRKAAGKVRITGQLIDAISGAHLWADRFEGDLGNIFALQDEVTANVISAIEPKLLQTEIQSAARRRPENLSAYDLCLRGAPRLYSSTREGVAEALQLFSRALELDPRFGLAATMAASCHALEISQGWTRDLKSAIEEATRLYRLALAIDENDPDALAPAGQMTALFSRDFDTAIEMVDRAVALNPNSAFAWRARGWTYGYAGRAHESIRSFEHAIRLSPLDPMVYFTQTGIASALIRLERFDAAVVAAKKSLRKNQHFTMAYRCLAVASAHLGNDMEARQAATRLLELEPDFRISTMVAGVGWWQSTQYIEGLRKAGLPE
jgi:adenylate cyclase